ncbi:peptidase M50B-like protein [Stackebrandtia albiflava]|uniref:Peptidase M50B-like protein n=1 Tax=Stackebrandtia albiflava TaxID=406432 RepID=A0A562UYG0_9ACTN|nr:M50 family metallopeptidase [Stackebrandtia albiflava]TWJ10633.1 peptidase M50B-like protein [Stackebrandtia albiflava]
METISTLFDHLFRLQAAPPTPIVVATAVVALLAVAVDVVWRRVRHAVTIAHEGGHALVALLTGRRLHGIRLHSDTSGVTFTRGRERGLSAVLTLLAGYLAPAVLGLLLAWLVGSGRVVLSLWLCLLLLVAMAVFIRNLYGVLAMLVTGAVVFAVAWWAPADVQATLAYLGVWLMSFGAIRPVWEVHRQRRGRRDGHSDPDQLAGITPVPALVWLLFFALANLAMLAVVARMLIPGLW